MTKQQNIVSGVVLVITLVSVLAAAFFAADYIAVHPDLQIKVAQFGYFGVTMLAIVAGLNVLIPVPAASFVPIFIAAGLSLPFIILALTIGTVIADYLGYAFGRWSSDTISHHYPRLVANLKAIYKQHRTFLIPTIFLYASFMPFPNEVLILPLAFLGVKFRIMLLPLLLGNLVNQTAYAIGIQNIFSWFF